jgi:hypothetical protein
VEAAGGGPPPAASGGGGRRFLWFWVTGFGVVEKGSMAGRSKGMAGGGGGGLWAVRPGGHGVAGRVVGDNRWVVLAAGANDSSGYEGRGGTV